MLESKQREILQAVRDGAAEAGLDASLSLHKEHSHLMRIGNNSVSLNTSETLSRLDIEVTDGKRQATHTHLGQIDSRETVQHALDIAAEKVKVAMPKDYQPPSTVVEDNVVENPQHDAALAELDPAVKAEGYARVINAVGDAYNYSGSWSSGVTELYLVSTANRNEAWHVGTDQRFNIVLKHSDRKWEISHTQTGWRASDVNSADTVDYLRSLLPVYEKNGGHRVEPGEYTVLFGAEAISQILGMAVWTGLLGRVWEEKRGWTASNTPGDAILGENIHLLDDPTDDNTFRFSFDLAGKKRSRFPLVDGGKLVQLMYDAGTAAQYGREATGHSGVSGSLVVKPGDGPEDPLAAVKGMGNVLYVPALHYTHVPNPSQGSITGSSRFGAVLVEDGQVTRPMFSSRVTDTFQNILGNVSVISSQTESVNGSNTYGRRSPTAMSVPTYMVAQGVKITDCADSF